MILPVDIPEHIFRTMCLRISYNAPRRSFGVRIAGVLYVQETPVTAHPWAKSFPGVSSWKRADLQEEGRQRCQVHAALLASCPVIRNRAPGFFLMMHRKWADPPIYLQPSGARGASKDSQVERPLVAYVLMKVPVAVMRCSDRWHRLWCRWSS